ncbi:hypothetical protein, partial [uncultured Limnobacter sp.]|uniref:phage tail protein n=1 Tax=uncultured Limnobacter sp. TaxID=199681 RepID=UPI0032B2CE15
IFAEIFGGDTKGIFDFILSWVKLLLEGALTFLKVIAALMPLFKLIGFLLKTIFDLLTACAGLIGAVFSLLRGDLEGFEKSMKTFMDYLSKAIGELLLEIIKFFLRLVARIWEGLSGLISMIWDGWKKLFGHIWELTGGFLTKLGKALLVPFKGLWDFIMSIFKQIDETFSFITKPIKGFLSWLWDMIKFIGEGIMSVLGPLKAAGKWLDDTFGFLLEDAKQITAESARAEAHASRARAARTKDFHHQKYLADKKAYLDKTNAMLAEKERIKKAKEQIKDIATINNLRTQDFDTIARGFGLGPGHLKAAMLGKGDDRINAFWSALSPDVQRLLVEKLRQAESKGRQIRVTQKGMHEEGSQDWRDRIAKGRQMAADQGLTNQMGVALMRKLGIKSWNDLFLEVGSGRTDVEKLMEQAFGKDMAKQFKSALAANKKAAGKKLLQQTGIIKTPQQEALEKQQRAMQQKLAMNMMQNPMMQRQMMQNMYKQMMFMKGQGGAGTNIVGNAARHLECACRHLMNIDRTTRSIDHTLKGKFVNQ